jgi:phosphonate transport system substrate-binding protein
MFMNTRRHVLALMSCAALSAAMAHEPAFAQTTVRFAVTDIDRLESLQREFGPFKAALEKSYSRWP